MTTDDIDLVAAQYRRFAETEAAGTSPAYEAWAWAVALDASLSGVVAGLDERCRQPNLVFAAARRLGAEPGDIGSLGQLFVSRRADVENLLSTRSTQTNEVGRCAALLPVLAALPPPLALLEVGASAGLCLFPDRYSYRYHGQDGQVLEVDPPDGPSDVRLSCRVGGPTAAPIPSAVPRVAWRAGIDLEPVDPDDAEQVSWMESLVWPEHHGRLTRLRQALAIRRQEPPPLVVRGDLVEMLPRVASQAPDGATLVVLHSATLAYLDPTRRECFVDIVRQLPGHWVSNEGRRVLDIAVPARCGPPTPDTLFTIALDGSALALGHGHGSTLRWLES